MICVKKPIGSHRTDRLFSFIKLALKKSDVEIHRNYCCQQVGGRLYYLDARNANDSRKYQHQRYEEYTLATGGEQGSYCTEAETLIKLVDVSRISHGRKYNAHKAQRFAADADDLHIIVAEQHNCLF